MVSIEFFNRRNLKIQLLESLGLSAGILVNKSWFCWNNLRLFLGLKVWSRLLKGNHQILQVGDSFIYTRSNFSHTELLTYFWPSTSHFFISHQLQHWTQAIPATAAAARWTVLTQLIPWPNCHQNEDVTPRGNYMDNIQENWRPPGTTILRQRFDSIGNNLETTLQLWDKTGGNFETTWREIWEDIGTSLEQLWDNFGSTLWLLSERALGSIWPFFE